ncbi:MAG: hypothetical protein JWM80_2615 [Cyanobacteria bacterium RYN_339]|nr:hypothetical protein [Cyanobacteria bacterium RYN_339]
MSALPKSAAQLVALIAMLLTFTPACAAPASTGPSPTPSADIAPIVGRWYEYTYIRFGTPNHAYRRERYTIVAVTGDTIQLTASHSEDLVAANEEAVQETALSWPVPQTVRLQSGMFWPFPRPIPPTGPSGPSMGSTSGPLGTFPTVMVTVGDGHFDFAGVVLIGGGSMTEAIDLKAFGH